jgi:hypothetical protein
MKPKDYPPKALQREQYGLMSLPIGPDCGVAKSDFEMVEI